MLNLRGEMTGMHSLSMPTYQGGFAIAGLRVHKGHHREPITSRRDGQHVKVKGRGVRSCVVLGTTSENKNKG